MSSNKDVLSLNKIYLLLREAEKLSSGPSEPEAFTQTLKTIETEWSTLQAHEHVYNLKRVFKNGWNPRKISDLCIAFERELNKNLADADFLITSKDNEKPRTVFPLEIALDSIRSGFNVGGFLRTAEAFGIAKIHFLGYSALPDDPAIQKTALGTEKKLEFKTWNSREDFFENLSKTHHVVGLETSTTAIPITDPWPKKPTVFIFGNERWGLDHTALKSVMEIREIPLFGQKNSLNVVVSAGVVIHEWIRQWRLNAKS